MLTSCSSVDPDRISHKPGDAVPMFDAGGDPPPDSSTPLEDTGPPTTGECTGSGKGDRCVRDNAVTACVGDDCLLVECVGAFVDCDRDDETGCEATLSSVEHCGLCGATCALPHAETRCEQGQCLLADCEAGYGDCDGLADNGCETSLDTLDDCGACERACDVPERGVPGCIEEECGVASCIGAYGDCDEELDNGCEQALSSLEHCGGCDAPCEPAFAAGDCATSVCVIESCEAEHVDCDGLPLNGCEATLQSVAHCGRCGAPCELPHAEDMRCVLDVTASCAVDHRCPEGADACVDDAPENGCEAGYADCNGLGWDGCETPLDTLSDCGSCGAGCAMPNAITSCDDGECNFVDCEPGFGRCADDDCVSLAEDEDHCGDCDTACEGTTPNCHGGKCTAETCAAGTADCDESSGNACETTLDSVDACGLCDLGCGPYDHASAACVAGRCTIDQCDADYDDCDGALSNGCETDLQTLEACGACRTSCVIPGAEASCEAGNCELDTCKEGRDDCNDDLTDGCETDLNLPTDCGACGLDCAALANVLQGGCSERACSIVCVDGFADCDREIENGCEADVTSSAHCGGCDNDCGELPNVQDAVCGDDQCEDLDCDPGFGDCDGVSSNGCERPLRTETDCGACNRPCAPARASGTCTMSGCEIDECDPGFADCNDDSDDGCEASLAEPEHCASCDNACVEGAVCDNGVCTCTSDEQCQTGESCCDGQCLNTQSACFWWPCLPGLARPLTNCGGCGRFCPDVLAASVFCCAVPPE